MVGCSGRSKISRSRELPTEDLVLHDVLASYPIWFEKYRQEYVMNTRKRRRLPYRGTMNTEFRDEKHGIDTFTDSSFNQFISVHLAPSFLGMFSVVWYAVSVSNNFPYRNLNILRNRLLSVIFRMIFHLVYIHAVDIGVHIFI